MNKGKMGITLTTYSILAFILALLGQLVLCGLLVAFVMVYEKDEYTSRQCMTAFFLSLANAALGSIAGGLMGSGAVIVNLSYRFSGLLGVILVLVCIVAVVMLVFGIIGLVNVSKKREAGVPLFSTFAYKAFGFMKPKPQMAPPPAAYNPAYQQGYQQPGYGQPPAGATPPPQAGPVPPAQGQPTGYPPQGMQPPPPPPPAYAPPVAPPVQPQQPPAPAPQNPEDGPAPQ